MYYSDYEPLFQSNPLDYKPSPFKLKSWTETIAGYINEASKERTLLIRNSQLQGHPYRWAVGINFEIDQTPKEISDTWAKVRRKLKAAGVVAYRILEITTDGDGQPMNRVHYHMIVKSHHTKADLERAIDGSIPAGIPYHKHVERIKNEHGYIPYIVKAKIGGFNKQGRWVSDKYADERILFRAKLGIKKLATVGDFFVKSKAAIWTEIKDQERRIGENLERPEIARLVKYIYEVYFCRQEPLDDIRRSIGLHADDEGIRRWAAKIEAQRKAEYQQAP